MEMRKISLKFAMPVAAKDLAPVKAARLWRYGWRYGGVGNDRAGGLRDAIDQRRLSAENRCVATDPPNATQQSRDGMARPESSPSEA